MKIKKYIHRILIISLLVLVGAIQAQRYPVQVTHTVFPPYSSKLSDYVTSSNIKFRLNIALTDVIANSEEVRLKLRIKGNGFEMQSTDIVAGAPQIFLTGGVLQQFTNLDLAAYFQPNNLIGITPQQYNRPLPEGMYTVCWEVYDAVTNLQVNNPATGCANIFLLLNDPPFLNLPYLGDYIVAKDPMNIIFQWTPRHTNATNVSYDFELRELWDVTMDPRAAFLAAPNYYTETLSNTTLLYDISKPVLLPKRTYGWRVKAKSVTGISENSIFKNNGYSEIFYFTYANPCETPTYVLSEALNGSTVKISWQMNFEHKKFHIQYKRADVPEAKWFEVYTYNNFAQIGNLQEGKPYLFRVGGSCNDYYELNETYSYSSVNQFTMPNKEEIASYNCGIVPDINIKGREPLKNIGVNETFTAGDFSVTVKEIYGGEGVFTGAGYIVVPYLSDTKIAVTFSNIRLNSHYQLIEGMVKTTYDPAWSGVEDVNDVVLGGNGNTETTTVDFSIEDVQIDPNGDIIIIGTNGEIVELPGGEDYVITDANGETWTVDEDGNVAESGTVAEGGATNSENTNGVNNQGEATAITAEGVTVTFTKDTRDIYGFDAYKKKQKKTKNLYKSLSDGYRIPYKSVAKGKTATIIANLDITDKNIKPRDIVFKTKEGIEIKKIDSTATSYTLELKGLFTDAKVETQAVVKQSDKYEIAGAFIQYQAAIKNVEVVLVNTTNKSTQKIKETLKKVYAEALVNISVTELNDFSNSLESIVSGSIIESGKSGFVSQYSKQQKQINKALKGRNDFKKEAYYILLTNKTPSTKNEKGLMPLGRQFGYVYMNNGADEKTVAHELGHGAFQLKHPFSKQSYGYSEKETDWLMDYGDAVKLPFVHWVQIHNPSLRIGVFDRDSEGQSVATTMPATLAINEKKYDGKYYYGYLTPSGERIVLSEEYTPVFFHGIEDDKYNTVVPGTLIGFKQRKINEKEATKEVKVEDITYKAKIVNNRFLGYENFVYEQPKLKGEDNASFVMGLPFGEPKSNKATWKNYKFTGENISEYKNREKEIMAITSDSFQNIGLFNALKPSKTEEFANHPEMLGDKQIDITELEIKLLSGDFNSEFVQVKKNNVGRVKNTKVSISHNERREVFLIVKIAEIYNRYPRIFESFTKFFNNWDQSLAVKTFSDYGTWDRENIPLVGKTSQAYKIWKDNLKLGDSNDELYDFYQNFLIELLAYTNQKATENKACLAADFATKSSKEVYECIAKASEYDLINLPQSKQIEGIKKILLGSTSGGAITDKEEIQVARILEAISNGNSANYQKTIDALENEKITYKWTPRGNRVVTKTEPLWHALFNNIQDEIFIFGNDNRQSIVKSIGKIFIGSENFVDQLKNSVDVEVLKSMTFEDVKSVHDNLYTYKNDYQNIFRRSWTNLGTSIRKIVPGIATYNSNDFYKSVDTKVTPDYLINAKQKLKWGFNSQTEKSEDLKPFDLISFINISKNNLLKPFSATNQQGDPQAIFVPAFTLHYASKTEALQTKSDIIQTSVDLLAFLPTGGTAALNTFGKFLYYTDKMSSVSSMAGIAFREVDPSLATYMNQLSLVTGVASLATLSKKLTVKEEFLQSKVGEIIHPDVLKETNNQITNVNKLVDDILQDEVHLQKLTSSDLQANIRIVKEEIELLKTFSDFNLEKANKAVEKLKNLDAAKMLYKNVRIVGDYTESYIDVEIAKLTTIHPVPRKSKLGGVEETVKDIQENGFKIAGEERIGGNPVRVIELPNGAQMVIDGMHRVEAMHRLKETHIPVAYNTYEEVLNSVQSGGIDIRNLENIYYAVHVGKRTGHYTEEWMPFNIAWVGNRRNEVFKAVDDFMKKEFPDLAESPEGLLASLQGLISNTKLKTVFESEFKGDIVKLKEFTENPNLVNAWLDIQRVLDKNADAFPKNVDFTGFNFDTGDNYIDVIIHYENGKFLSKVETEEKVISIEKLAEVINSLPSDQKIRLLSCSTEQAAIELSKLTEKPFYANDGRVKLYPDGEVVHVTPFTRYHKGARSDLEEIPPNIKLRKETPIILGRDANIKSKIERILNNNSLQEAIVALKLSSEKRIAFIKYIASLDEIMLEEVLVKPSLLEPIKVQHDTAPKERFDLSLMDLQQIQRILKKIGGYVKWKTTAKGEANQLWNSIEIDSKDHAYVILLDGIKTDEIGGFTLSKQGTFISTIDLPSYLRQQKIATEIFERGIKKYQPIKIEETWGDTNLNHSDVSTNLEVYLSELRNGRTREQAAFATPSGKLARQNGYTGTPIFKVDTKTKVHVFFIKPVNDEGIYKNVQIVTNPKGTEYPEKVRDVKISELTMMHPVNANEVDEVVNKIKEKGFLVDNSNLVDIVELPNNTKLVLDGMHRVEAMGNRLKENYIPVYYNTYNDFKHDEDEIEKIYFSLLLARRTGYYNKEWMPEAPWMSTETKIRLLESVNESIKRDFSNLIESKENILESLKVLVPSDLQKIFKNTFKENTAKLLAFAEKPALVNAWVNTRKVFKENATAFPKNINFVGFNFNTKDDYIDVIIHYGEGNFVSIIEGKQEIIPIENVAEIINSIPETKKVRLLSCNTNEAALALSKIIERPFYASDGVVKIYTNGIVKHNTPFKKYHRGARSDLEEIPPSSEKGRGESISLGKEESNKTKIDEVFKENADEIKRIIEELDFSKKEIEAFTNYAVGKNKIIHTIEKNPSLVAAWKAYYNINREEPFEIKIEELEKVNEVLNGIGGYKKWKLTEAGEKNRLWDKITLNKNDADVVLLNGNTVDIGSFGVTSFGILGLNLELPKYLQKQRIVSDLYSKVVRKLTPKEVKSVWLEDDLYEEGMSTNLLEYLKYLDQGMNRRDAALMTPAGKLATKNEFTGEPIFLVDKKNRVEVIFTKKENEIRTEVRKLFEGVEAHELFRKVNGIIQKIESLKVNVAKEFIEEFKGKTSNLEKFLEDVNLIDNWVSNRILTKDPVQPNSYRKKEIEKIFKKQSSLIENKVNELNFSEEVFRDFIENFSKVEKEVVLEMENNPRLIDSWRAYYDINKKEPFKIEVDNLKDIDAVLKSIGGYTKWKATEAGKENRLWSDIKVSESEFQLVYLNGEELKIGNFNISEINTLSFDIILPSVLQKQKVTTKIFKEIFKKHKPVEIQCHWVRADTYEDNISTNLLEYFKYKDKGRAMAAFMTPSGKIARRNGFTQAPVFIKDNDYEVKVIFTKSNETKRRELRKLFSYLQEDTDLTMNTFIGKVESFDKQVQDDFINDCKKSSKQFLEVVFKNPQLLDNWKLMHEVKSVNRTDVNFLRFLNINLVIDSRNKVKEKYTLLIKKYPNISLEELTTVYHYTSSLYTVENFNKALRERSITDKKLKIFDNVLRKSLEKFPKYLKTTYRGISTKKSALKKYEKAYENKTEIEELGYISTSKERFVAEVFLDKNEDIGNVKVLFTIESKKGLDIEDISLHGPTFSSVTESEVLFISGQKFKVSEYKVTKGEDQEELVLITLTD